MVVCQQNISCGLGAAAVQVELLLYIVPNLRMLIRRFQGIIIISNRSTTQERLDTLDPLHLFVRRGVSEDEVHVFKSLKRDQ